MRNRMTAWELRTKIHPRSTTKNLTSRLSSGRMFLLTFSSISAPSSDSGICCRANQNGRHIYGVSFRLFHMFVYILQLRYASKVRHWYIYGSWHLLNFQFCFNHLRDGSYGVVQSLCVHWRSPIVEPSQLQSYSWIETCTALLLHHGRPSELKSSFCYVAISKIYI